MLSLILPEVVLHSADLFRCSNCWRRFGVITPQFAVPELRGWRAAQYLAARSYDEPVLLVATNWTSRTGLTDLRICEHGAFDDSTINVKHAENYWWPGDLTPGWKWRRGLIVKNLQIAPYELKTLLWKHPLIVEGVFHIDGAGKRRWAIFADPPVDEIIYHKTYVCRVCKEKEETSEVPAPASCDEQ